MTKPLIISVLTIAFFAVPAQLSAQTPPEDAEPETVPEHEHPDPLKIYGDVRARFEHDHREGPFIDADANDRSRARLRARLGVHYDTPADGLAIGIRLASNVGTPGNSPHQTLSLASENIFNLDRAYISYTVHDLTLTAGKQSLGHWQQTEIMWDADIQPEGVAMAYDVAMEEAGEMTLDLGYFWLRNEGWEEDPFSNDGTVAWQFTYAIGLGPIVTKLGATGMHLFDGGEETNKFAINPDDTMSDEVVTGDANFMMGSLQLKNKTSESFPVEIMVGADVAAGPEGVTGIELGDDARLGWVVQSKIKWAGAYVRYAYYDIGEISVPYYQDFTFTEADFPNSRGGAPTGYSGHRAELGYAFTKHLSAKFRFFALEGNEENVMIYSEPPERTWERYQFNVDAKF